MDVDQKFRHNLFKSAISLHDWRRKYNGDKIGFGYDQYKLNEEFHYADAYAFWGRGYLKLFQITHQEEYLNSAKKCADWLIKNKNLKYENFSWGLPWKWNGRPKEFSYITTSTFAGYFFIHLYEVTRDEEYLNVAKSIGDWIIKEDGFRDEPDGIWFSYSDHISLNYPIINAIAMSGGFFSRLYLHTQNKDYEKLAAGSARYVINNQNEDGSWYYSTERAYIDNIHTGFTIEGLCTVYAVFPSLQETLQRPLMAAHDFYWNRLYTTRGFGKENLGNSLLHKIKIKTLPISIETRLCGYATGIRAFTKLSRTLGIENNGLIITKYVIENLQTETGAFRFKSNKNKYYIRNEAHIFDALATVVSEDTFIIC